MDELKDLIDDLGDLGLDTTKVCFKPVGSEVPLKKGEGEIDFGWDLAQEYRTSNGVRISSITANGIDSGIVTFGKNVHITFNNLGNLNETHPPSLLSSNSIFLYLPLEFRLKLEHLWRDSLGQFHIKAFGKCTPAVIILILKLLKVKVDLESGEISWVRDIDRMEKLIDRLQTRTLISFFPIAQKVVAKTIGSELVPVFPMDAPAGNLIYL